MKAKLVGTALFVLTTAAVAYPALKSNGSINTAPIPVAPIQNVLPVNRPVIDVVFVLDTTGSMSGLIDAAKEKIWSIASSMASAQPAPIIRMGLVGYRDRGDEYVTRVVDLSTRHRHDVRNADAVHRERRRRRSRERQPGAERRRHADVVEPGRQRYKVDLPRRRCAAAHGLSGRREVSADARARRGQRHRREHDSVRQRRGRETTAGSRSRRSATAATSTSIRPAARWRSRRRSTPTWRACPPHSTRRALYYGTQEEKARTRAKVDATDALHALASPASQARRAAFNASDAGVINAIGENELVADVASGRVDLAKVEADKLPEPLQALSVDERKKLVSENAAKRSELQRQIKQLADQRDDYAAEQIAAAGGAKDSLDDKIYGAVREQAEKKGLTYPAAAPKY